MLIEHNQFNENVGPGAYTFKEIDRKPKTMFLPRSGLRSKPILFNNGSIKDGYVNFDEEIEDLDSKHSMPGPGSYLTYDSSFKDDSKRGRYTSMQ